MTTSSRDLWCLLARIASIHHFSNKTDHVDHCSEGNICLCALAAQTTAFAEATTVQRVSLPTLVISQQTRI